MPLPCLPYLRAALCSISRRDDGNEQVSASLTLHEPSVPDRVKVQSTVVNALDFASRFILLLYLSVSNQTSA